MTIIITGASGHFGTSAAEKLLERVAPSELILVSRKPDRLSRFSERGCQVRYGDFDDPASLRAAFAGGDRMLLISGTRVGKRLPQHEAAISAAREAGVGHIVYTSFLGADNPDNPSEAVIDHRATEEVLRQSGVAWTALRNAQYADAVTDVMAHTMAQGGVMLSVAGDGRMPFVWREDCVDAAVAVLTSPGHENRAYAITGPEQVPFRELATLIAEFTGRPVEFRITDEAGLYAMFDGLGVPREPSENPDDAAMPWNSNDMVSFEAGVRDGHFAIDSQDTERLVGRRPRSLRALFEAKAGQIAAPTDIA